MSNNADGSVIIDAQVRLKQAQADLNRLEQETEKTTKSMQQNMDKAAASSVKMGAALKMLPGVMRLLKGVIPGLTLAGITTGLIALVTRQAEAKEAAEIHAKALRGLNEDMRTTAEIAALVEKNIRNMSEVQLAYAAEKLGAEAQRIQNEMYALLAGMSTASISATGELDETSAKLYELREGITAGTIDIKDFQRELGKIKQANPGIVDKLKQFEDYGMQLFENTIATDKYVEKEKELSGTLSASEQLTLAAARAHRELRAALDKVSESAVPQNAEDALRFLENYTRNTNLGKEQAEAFAKSSADAAKAILLQGAAAALVNGDLVTYVQTMNQLANFNARIASGVATGGKRSSSSGADQTARALQSIKDKIEDIKRSGGETLVQRMDREWERMSRNVKGAGKELSALEAQFREVMKTVAANNRMDYDRGLAKEIAQLTGQTEKLKALELGEHLSRIKRETRELGFSIEETRQRQYAFIDAWDKQVNTEHLQEQLDFMKEFEQLSGQYGLSLNLQNQVVAQQAEAYRTAMPQLSSYIDQWERLKLLETDQSWEAGISRAAQTYIAEWTNASNVSEKIFTSMIDTLESASSTMVDAIWGDAEFRADEFLKNLLKDITKMLLNQQIARLFSFMGFGSFHTGGIVGIDSGPQKFIHPGVFTNAPRYHAGGIAGLASYEVPAILKQGEGVFTPAQMRMLSPVNAVPKVEVTIVDNAPNTSISQQQQVDGNGNVNFVVTIDEAVASRVTRGGATAKALEARYGLKPHGMGRG